MTLYTWSPDRQRAQDLASRARRRADRRYQVAPELWQDAAYLAGRLERRAAALKARDADRAASHAPDWYIATEWNGAE